MKKVLFLIASLLILGLVFAGCGGITNITAPGTTETEGVVSLTRNGEVPEIPLYAGQHKLVGEVIVTVVGDTLCVEYVLDQDALEEGWLIYETHIAVGEGESDIPQKNGNPIPGHFSYGDDELDGVESYEECDIPIPVDCDVPFVIAAHAVIEKTECGPLTEAPYGGFQVVNSLQGLRYDYTDVRAERSKPDTVLIFEVGHNESYFFSLGFNEDRPEYLPLDNAWIIVEFDKPIQNGPGDDLQLVEDTWGLPYPDETADVWVSQDGVNWEYLGEADNQNPVSGYHTITNFDLDVAGLEWVKFVKVQNTSIRSDFAHLYPGQKATLDGYDLNAILALQDYQECTTYSETAWGGEEGFFGKNWAKYFTYDGLCWEETLTILAKDPSQIGVTTTYDLKEGCQYLFEASGTCNWRFPPSLNGYLADAGFWLRNDDYGIGWTQPSIGGSIAYWDGTTKEGIDWDEDYNDDHIYTYVFTATETGPMTFFFNDDQYGDNSGFLTLKISSCFQESVN